MTTQSSQVGNPAAFAGSTPAAAPERGHARTSKALLPSLALILCMLPSFADPAEQTGVIQAQDTTTSGIVAELIQCKRHEGVLNIKLRFHNTSSKALHFAVVTNHYNNPESYYYTAENKKYFILKDTEGTYLSVKAEYNELAVDIAPGESYTWWAKYPAPPAEIKKINFITAITSPFEDVPITDQ